MLQRNASSPPQRPQSKQQPRQHWQEYGGNKRQKKRILDGHTKGQRPHGTEKRERTERERQAVDYERGCGAVLSALTESFANVPDPRVNRRRRHLLIDIIIITVLAVMSRAEGWKDIQVWGKANEVWLRTFLELPNGIPSRDTFRRTVSRLDPEQFQRGFVDWLSRFGQKATGVIAIDGKSVRRSMNGDKGPLHIVSAWACEQHLTLGQRAVDGKSNEIIAIPKLLASLALKGATVTIDAMGCQKNIAAQIVDEGADYSLAVKDNQPTLAEDVANAFIKAMENDFKSIPHHAFQTHDKGHGRTEVRYYYTMPVPETLRTKHEWAGLKSIGMTFTYRHADRDCDPEVRYYINSFASDAKRFASAVRSHWGIENSLHWVMDVTFREDECPVHKDHGAENLSWVRRLAISLIKLDTTYKDSIRAKRIRAGYDVEFLKQMLASIAAQI